MDVFNLRNNVIADYGAYVRSFLTIKDERISRLVREEMDGGYLWPDPLIQLNPTFEAGEPLQQLIDEGELHPECIKIFRDKREDGHIGAPLRLHRHQIDGIRAARAGDSYVLTTGTGSGKSLAYIVPIVDHVLRRGSGKGIQAIIVYPMNALANSQVGELEKFLRRGYPAGRSPVTFRRYTGQESDDERKEIIASPPDILLTNYVMLELVLTRPWDYQLIDAARKLRFLVLDELHTYRGRQGAGVAMLVRRVREACDARDILHVGTSATLAGRGTWAEQQVEVAAVASRLFGVDVKTERVIGETLRRATLAQDLTDPVFVERLRARLQTPPATSAGDTNAFLADPLSIWIESTLGLREEEGGRQLLRCTPRSLSGDNGVAAALARITGLEREQCEVQLREMLLSAYRYRDTNGHTLFPFRLHQFVSKGDSVYVSPEPEAERHVTLQAQQFVPGSGRAKVLLPVAFCRECGQEYFSVRRSQNQDGRPVYLERSMSDRLDNDDGEAGYLYISEEAPWPDDAAEFIPKLPDTWLETTKDGVVTVRKSQRQNLPRKVFISTTAVEGEGDQLASTCWGPATRRIAKRLAGVRAGEDEPSPKDVQHALRDVVGRCIYGVDVNPMAVERCKISLWMEAVEPGRPLSFLDSHIQCGNALLGAEPTLMARGIPDVAFKTIEGDDKDIASRLRRQNKREREAIEAGQETWFAAFDKAAARDVEAVTERTKEIEGTSDECISTLRVKEQRWESLTRSAEFRDAWFLADAWCAAFVWPKEFGNLATAAVTAERWRNMMKDVTTTPTATRKIIRDLAAEFRFFHWHLAFPTVVESGGFDLILGNPPWDTLSPDQREFFEQYQPGMRSLSPDEQKQVIDGLLEDRGIAQAWAENRRFLYALVHFLKSSGRFTLFAPGNLGKGDFNVYRMFAELALKGARNGGYAAQVLPGGLYGGANASAIRKFLFDECELQLLLGLINTKRGWFGEVDIDRFCAYAARRGGRTGTFHVRFGLHSPADLTTEPLPMNADTIRQQAPDAYTIPDTRQGSDITISAKMYERCPAFGDESADPPVRHYQAELHMGNDRELFTTDPAGLPVYEGRMIDNYDHRAKIYVSGHGNSAVWEARGFGDPEKVIVPQWRVLREDVPSKLGHRVDRFRIGFGDVANPRNQRSLVATLIPPSVICGHTVPTITFDEEMEWAYLPWLAVANSFTMDALARKKLSSPHMTFSILDSLPFPRPRLTADWMQRLAPLVLRLICTAPEMTPYWNEMAEHGLCAPAAPGSVPSTALLDEEARAVVRAEIDAVVAHDVFGLTREELSDILDTFPVLQRREAKEYGKFRTKFLVLDAFESLETSREHRRTVNRPADAKRTTSPAGEYV